MSTRFASSELLNDMCRFMNDDTRMSCDHLVNQMIATCDLTIFTENTSHACANSKPSNNSHRSVVFEDDEYKLVFLKIYDDSNYPTRRYHYYFSSGEFSYFREDNQNIGAMELNEKERTFRYVPRLDLDFVDANIN